MTLVGADGAPAEVNANLLLISMGAESVLLKGLVKQTCEMVLSKITVQPS